MEKYKLEKPDISKINNKELIDKFLTINNFGNYSFRASYPNYLFWDRVKYLERPSNFSDKEFWLMIKLFRKNSPNRINSIIITEKGEYFTWQPVSNAESFYHEVTQQCSGNLKLSNVTSEKQKQYYMSKGVMEEAIASSQLEGAAVTRKVAKKMIREKRKPKNKSEQMILNNFNTIIYIEQEFQNKELSLENLCELQSMLTENTFDDDTKRGRLRKDSDEIVVENTEDGKVLHSPPKEEFLKSEIKRLLDYANDKISDVQFVHPVTKAIVIHFWIGYLHPFCDGNGRLARALFYWYLLKHNYWVFSYLPLSKIIKESPVQYRNAYLYTEQDDLDLTYFIDYNIRKIKQALSEFELYVAKKQKQNKKMILFAQSTYNLNDRQINLILYLYNNSEESTTINTHSTVNAVSRVTARKDLIALKEYGFLTSKKIGKYVHYYATEKVNELFE